MKWIVMVMLLGGCSREAVYDERASAAFHAAWQKKAKGDEAGYRAALEQVKKDYPNTRAGERARELLAK